MVLILLSAMAAGLALIPLALGGGQSGSEIQTPMAIVILCGLMTSTFLNMVDDDFAAIRARLRPVCCAWVMPWSRCRASTRPWSPRS